MTATYHRGQNAMLVRVLTGGEPAITDLIYGCKREPVAGAGGL